MIDNNSRFLQIFKENLNNFVACTKQQNALKEQEYSRILSTSFFYNWDFRKTVSYLLSSKHIENPKSKMEYTSSSSEVKNFLTNANPDFYLGVMPSKDPPLSSIKLKKKKDLVFLDLTSCYLSSSDSLRALHKFSYLQYLCLSDCGIVDLSNDIINLPKTIRSLDLSKNFISQIPTDIHWKQLEYLNLSGNALSKWPDAIDPDRLPNIVAINLSINSIVSFPSLTTPFTKLQTLSLDHNPFNITPLWLIKCVELKYLSFKGCANLKDLHLNLLFNLPHLTVLDISDVNVSNQSINKVPNSLSLIICRAEKESTPRLNLRPHNINCTDDNVYRLYSKNNSNIPVNNEFDYATWDLG